MALDASSPRAVDDLAPSVERTIGRLWRDAVTEDRPQPPYMVETEAGWHAVPWREAAAAVEELAAGLLKLGVRKGDCFAIVARTTLEWALFDFALALVGAVAAPVYPSSSADDTRYVVEHSEALGILAEDDAQLEKASGVALEHRLTFSDLDALRAQGREFVRRHPGALAAAEAAVGEDDLFTYIYTSGTTGRPKACIISHRNYYELCVIVGRVEGLLVGNDLALLYLPLAHNFGRLIHLLGPHLGFTIAFCPDPLRLGEAMPAVRPTVLPSVPRVYEKVHAAVMTRFDEASGARRRLIDWALDVGRQVSAKRREGRELPAALAVRHRLADRLVYRKIKARMGGRLRLAISGGAPLTTEIAEFFHALDIHILEGYGQSECTSACTVNRPDRFRFGTVGPALPGIELRTADDGELEISSPTVCAGYLKDDEATSALFTEDGWLRTGDIAVIDDDGFVSVTDRKKDIIVTAGGKKVAPQNLENELTASRYVSQALVIGDRRPYVAALITLDGREVRKWAAERGIAEGDVPGGNKVRELIQAVVDAVNEGRSSFEQIKRFAILARDFTPERDEVTPTLKLRRHVCEQHFADDIDRLYAGS